MTTPQNSDDHQHAMGDRPSFVPDPSRQVEYTVTPQQWQMLKNMEELGLADKERLTVLAAMVKESAAWSVMRKWLIQIGAVIGAGGAILAAIEFLRTLR